MRYERHAARALALVLLVATVLPVSALAAPADVDGSLTAIRLSGDGVTSAVEAISSSDSPISVTADQAKGRFEVVYQDESGNETTATVTAADPNVTLYAKVTTGSSTLRVRQGPGTNYTILCSVRDGSFFAVTGKTDGWYQIACNGRTGYVSADYVVERTLDQILDEKDTKPTVDPDSGVPTADPADYDRTLANQIVDYALQYLGYPYVYATAGPDSFDCSGFTSYVYKHFGYSLHRSSYDQLKDGKAVQKADLLPGDILLFSRNGDVVTHVGLYIGNGEFIHASTSTTGVIISDLYSDYYVQHYYAARRII